MTERERKRYIEIQTIIRKLKGRSTWVTILRVLYENKDYAVTSWDVLKYMIKYKGVKPYVSRINDILGKMEAMGIVSHMEIKGLRGKRWYLTEKGLEICKMVFQKKDT
jgi:hypothetical protein